jgi:uncharacterized protein (DUF305 family)
MVAEQGRSPEGLMLCVAVACGALLAYGMSQYGCVRSQEGAIGLAQFAPASLSGNQAAGQPGPVSIGFAQDMTVHHEQALQMARMAFFKGSPQVRSLADGIINQQQREIGYMQGWLLLWNASPLADDGEMQWMKQAYARSRERDEVYEQFIASCGAGQPMPGLASGEELAELAELEGAAFDKRFLAMMVRHHQAATVMARFTFEHAELEVVRAVAASMGGEQRQEMALMMRMLAQMP